MSSSSRKSTKKKSPSRKVATPVVTPSWNKTKVWNMDDCDVGVPPGVFAQDAQFQLLQHSDGNYYVTNVTGTPPAWLNQPFIERGLNWPKAAKSKTPKYSKGVRDKFMQQAQDFLDSFGTTIKHLEGKITASNGDICRITMFQVPDQISGGFNLLIIWVNDTSSPVNQDGGVYGHS